MASAPEAAIRFPKQRLVQSARSCTPHSHALCSPGSSSSSFQTAGSLAVGAVRPFTTVVLCHIITVPEHIQAYDSTLNSLPCLNRLDRIPALSSTPLTDVAPYYHRLCCLHTAVGDNEAGLPLSEAITLYTSYKNLINAHLNHGSLHAPCRCPLWTCPGYRT